MPVTTAKLTTAVEEYFADLRRIRASGGATGERSFYPALTNLLNAVGSSLRPQVFCVGELAEQGAGQTFFGLPTPFQPCILAATKRNGCWTPCTGSAAVSRVFNP